VDGHARRSAGPLRDRHHPRVKRRSSESHQLVDENLLLPSRLVCLLDPSAQLVRARGTTTPSPSGFTDGDICAG
jgi:hypothetical protein